MQSFQRIRVLDLHGNTLKKEVPPSGGRDVNVFDIRQGVAIGLFTKTPRNSRTAVFHNDLWGERRAKYRWLLRHDDRQTRWPRVEAAPPFYLFEPFENSGADGYSEWSRTNEIMPVNVTGVVTARDKFVIDLEPSDLIRRIRTFVDMELGDADVKERLGLRENYAWRVATARQDLAAATRGKDLGEFVAKILYRPFDHRFIFWDPSVVWRPRLNVMAHMLGENVGISTTRTVEIGTGFSHVFATRAMTQHHTVSLKEVNYLFPLYLHPGVGKSGVLPLAPWPKGRHGRRPNLDPGFVDRLAEAAVLRFVPDGTGDLRDTFGPEDVLAYIYAVFHSPGYRKRYEAHLRLDFPRVPLPGRAKLGRKLMKAGHELLSYHLMESPDLDYPLTDYAGPRAPMVGRVGWSNGTVWLDAAATKARQRHRATKPGQYGFHGVREDVWDFQIGGYQVCHKWLKDRKGRTLSDDDIAHYQKIVVAVTETISIMAAIDGVVEHFGGWPGAFGGERESAEKAADLAKVAESQVNYGPGEPTKDAGR